MYAIRPFLTDKLRLIASGKTEENERKRGYG